MFNIYIKKATRLLINQLINKCISFDSKDVRINWLFDRSGKGVFICGDKRGDHNLELTAKLFCEDTKSIEMMLYKEDKVNSNARLYKHFGCFASIYPSGYLPRWVRFDKPIMLGNSILVYNNMAYHYVPINVLSSNVNDVLLSVLQVKWTKI